MWGNTMPRKAYLKLLRNDAVRAPEFQNEGCRRGYLSAYSGIIRPLALVQKVNGYFTSNKAVQWRKLERVAGIGEVTKNASKDCDNEGHRKPCRSNVPRAERPSYR
ncbi:hypothetical protein KM043_009696 [Ampulex compressa]|nr:hypothetical protein KM043_009696 [Ampulex compressa]